MAKALVGLSLYGGTEMEKWFIQAKRADFFAIGNKFHIDPVIARVIRNRNVIGDSAIEEYLHGDLSSLHDPHQLKDADKAVKILIEKIQQHKKVRIISDYDVDGVISNYILWTGFQKCGMNVDFRIPDRIVDGYGINERLIAQAKEDGVDTIVTCDNGIAAIDQIAYAKELGLTVVVTDHHDIPYEMSENGKIYLSSNADAIVNPKQPDCPYPFDKLCGAVVAMKVVQVLYEQMGFAKDAYEKMIPFAAIATVCDVVDLTGENRALVRVGLNRLPGTPNVGLQALLEVNGLLERKISSYHLGFVVGPCINATGRLESAEDAVNLLLEQDPVKAKMMAQKLKDLNEERKSMTEDGLKLAYQMVEEKGYEKDQVLVIFLPDCHESLAGIIAGRVKERYYKPTIVLTRAEESVKGSGRSIEGYHMFEKLNEVKNLLVKFGGHPMAAGMSLREEDVDAFRKRLNENAGLTEEILTRKVSIDVAMPIDYIHIDLIKQLELLEPFGKENPKPVFAEKDLYIASARRLGKKNNVLKLRLQNGSGKSVEGLLFQGVEEFEQKLLDKYGKREVECMYSGRNHSIRINCTYYPNINEYQGRQTIQIVIQNYQIR
jgi:single-stranded-DNA-specific exonuclease